jgi:hypothetical protein
MSKTNACSINDTVSLLASAVSSPTGLDGGLMAIQYASPLVAAALLKIIQVAKEHPQLLTVNSKRLADLAGAVVRAGGSIGEARTISRTFGE